MSLVPHTNSNKRCFVYCGDDVCDCGAAPVRMVTRHVKGSPTTLTDDRGVPLVVDHDGVSLIAKDKFDETQ